MKNPIVFGPLLVVLMVAACASGSGGTLQNDSGTLPLNGKEEIQYKQELLRCYKTGGSRIVKIEGRLRCF